MASQGPNSPGTAAIDSSYGNSFSTNWELINNVKTENGTSGYMGYSFYESGDSQYLKCSDFGFTIPSGATIGGIVVEIKKYKSDDPDSIKDARVRIVKSNGSVGSTDRADTGSVWSTSLSYVGYGGSSDLWGESWSYSDINNSNFGMVISIYGNDTNKVGVYAFIDHIRITVYYTEGGSSSAIKSVNGLAKASVKSFNGLAIASVKNINGLA